jgi:hypothetical protein
MLAFSKVKAGYYLRVHSRLHNVLHPSISQNLFANIYILIEVSLGESKR